MHGVACVFVISERGSGEMAWIWGFQQAGDIHGLQDSIWVDCSWIGRFLIALGGRPGTKGRRQSISRCRLRNAPLRLLELDQTTSIAHSNFAPSLSCRSH